MKEDVNVKNYRLVELRAENFRKLKAVRIKIDGSVLQVGGRNQQGKSSLLDVVAAGIGGKDAFPATPIRKGASSAEIMLNFGGLKLTRTITPKDGGGVDQKLVFEYADGRRPKNPQAVLDELRGSPIADDPVEFSRMKPKDQFDLLKQLVPGVDFNAIARERQKIYDERTQVGRDYDRAKATAESAARDAGNLDDIPTTMVDVAGLAAELRAVSDHNSTIDRRQAGRDSAAAEIEGKRDEADQLMAKARKLNEEADELQKKLNAAEPLPAKKDAAAIEKQIAEAENRNELVRFAAQARAKVSDSEALGKRYDALTLEIDAVDKQKTDAIAAAKLPVPGLGFGDDEILLDGLPFSDASTARKIRTATALLMALKPDLRVLLVREGSLLDKDARAALQADAEANDFVVLMETVGDVEPGGIVIEDGEVVS